MSAKPLRRIKKWLFGLLLLSAGIALMMKFIPRERNLLAQATKVANVSKWWNVTDFSLPLYEWLSDEVLFSHPGPWLFSNTFTFDTRTGKQTPLTKLNAQIRSQQDGDVWVWELSPDRQWLLWTPQLSGKVRAVRLDGLDLRTYELPGNPDPSTTLHWQQDSRHWLAEHYVEKRPYPLPFVSGDIDMPGETQAIPLSEAGRHTIPDTEVRQIQIESQGYVGLLPSGMPLYRIWRQQLPEESQLEEVIADDSGQRLAWIFLCIRQPAYSEWFRRLRPGYSVPTQCRAELWVSRKDGTELHLVGYVVVDELSMSRKGVTLRLTVENEPPVNLRWLPDGKRISFVYKGGIYTVPVD
jgi:hypothetical protein